MAAHNPPNASFTSETLLTRRVQEVSPTTSLDRLCLFSFGWAVASLLHCLSFGDRLNAQHPFSLGLLTAALLVILRPQSVGLFLVMLCLSIGNTLDWMPIEPNHILFEFILNVGMVGALGWTIVRQQYIARVAGGLRSPAARAALFAAFAPFARISLVLLYFYAVLHKLNYDYFTVALSCSTALLKGYGQRLPFLPTDIFSQWAAVWGTILLEAAIPLCLCFRKTRFVGLLLGVGFHFFLAIHPAQGLYSFSGLLFALYLVFVPAQLLERGQHLAQRLLRKSQLWLPFAVRLAGCLAVVGLVASGRSAHLLSLAGLLLWLGWSLLCMAALVLLRGSIAGAPRQPGFFRIRPAAFWLVPAIVLFNGMNPYLGLKTEKTFAMFSNLRTEGGISNHLFLTRPLYLTHLQQDLVEITSSNLDQLQRVAASQQLITYFEFRRIASEAKTNFYVSFIRDGKPQTVRVVNGISTQPNLIKPYPWLVAKFVRFRSVDKGRCSCKH